jgi:3',5'-cyclic AMP phosphodiesterase CpdA
MRVIAHLSDLHFGRIDPVLLEPLHEAVSGVAPDLIAVSGDFTQRARQTEFKAARAFLDRFDKPQLYVPGNHDIPFYNVARRFFTPLTRYRKHISEELEPEYVDDEMIVIGINTARSLAIGEGRINGRQVARVVARLATVPPAVLRIVVTHHPFDLPPGVHERRLLGRNKMAMAQLATANADLFLSGHLHLSHVSHAAERYEIAGHSALIVQAGTVSTRSRGEQPSFNVLWMQRPEIRLSRFVWDEATAGFKQVAVGQYRHSERGWKAVDHAACVECPG